MAMRFAVLGSAVVGVMCTSAYAQPGAPGPVEVPPPGEALPPSEPPPAPSEAPTPYAPPIEGPGAPAARELSMVEKLTLGARNASRDGRCDSIAMIGARVRQLDPAYYQNVFVVDPTIANCRQGMVIRPQPVYAPPPVAQSVEVEPLPSEIIEVKSPGTALALSFGITIGGLALAAMGSGDKGSGNEGESIATLGSLAFLVGPTIGHAYAGNAWNTGLKWRLGSLGVMFGGALYAISQCGYTDGCPQDERDRQGLGIAVAIGGVISYFGATIYEIATAPSSAREYNLEYTRYQMKMRPRMQIIPAAGRAPGLSLVGTF